MLHRDERNFEGFVQHQIHGNLHRQKNRVLLMKIERDLPIPAVNPRIIGGESTGGMESTFVHIRYCIIPTY